MLISNAKRSGWHLSNNVLPNFRFEHGTQKSSAFNHSGLKEVAGRREHLKIQTKPNCFENVDLTFDFPPREPYLTGGPCTSNNIKLYESH